MTDGDKREPVIAILADRQAITERIYRYCRAVDRLDRPLGYSIWHEDAVADYGDVYRGPGRGVIDVICASHLHLTAHSHQVSNITIDLDGDCAASEAYATVTTRALSGETILQMTMWVRYLDMWSKRKECWAIDKRVMVMDFDEMREVRPLGNAIRGRRDGEDPAYGFLKSR